MSRRNIVFIYANQMHGFAMGCMNDPNAYTPNLDCLAEQGTLFTTCYTSSPVCSPFRVNLMTGLYGNRTNALRNEARIPHGLRTLPQSLNDAGYCTSYVGKWYVGGSGNKPVPPESRAGFKEFIGYQAHNSYTSDILFWDEDGNERQFEGHRTEATTDVAIERLRRRAQADEPFALFVSYLNPHFPLEPSAAFYESLYSGRRMIRRKNAQDIDPFTPTASPPSLKPFERDPAYRRYGKDLDEYLRCYYALIAQLDVNVGMIVDELDALGIADETLVVFTSDHGDMQGSHGLKNKSVPYEEATRIPLIVRAPGTPEGTTAENLVSSVDFAPTLLDWAGAEPLPDQDGRSILPALDDPSALPQRPIFSEIRGWCMVRDGNYKLCADRVYGKPIITPRLLFDLEADPHEMWNRIHRREHEETRGKLMETLVSWDRDVRARQLGINR